MLFKAFDIRAKREDLSPLAEQQLALAVARYISQDTGAESVVLARDARLYSPGLMESLLEAFLSYGLDVLIDVQQITTCRFYFMCLRHHSSCGVMVTASHNPGEYLGLKITAPGCVPVAYGMGPSGGLERIRSYFEENDITLPSARGRIRIISMQDEFIDYTLILAGCREGELSGLKVFSDFLSGAAGSDFVKAFSCLGADITASGIVPDGFFPAGDPNPGAVKAAAHARNGLLASKCNVGFCFDGDGDRMDVLFPDGNQMLPLLNLSLIVPYLKGIFPQDNAMRVYADPKSVPPALEAVRHSGAEPHLIRSGHSYIKERLRTGFSSGYFAAVEGSAHYYMNFPSDSKDFSKGPAATENTLFFSILTAKAFIEKSSDVERVRNIQNGIFRVREWSRHFETQASMTSALDDISAAIAGRGAEIIRTMDDGSDLDAALMRIEDGRHWVQVSQRVSRSEDSLARWEISADSEVLCNEFDGIIKEILMKHGIL